MTSTVCLSPVSGEIIGLENVKDPVFAAGTLGDGIAIRPVENTVSAPLGGTLKVMFHTGHAFVIESEDGQEVMVHVGIDTVKYKGEGFEVLKAQGDRVKPGEVIVRFYKRYLKAADMTTMVILMDEKRGKRLKKTQAADCVRGKDIILEWQIQN